MTRRLPLAVWLVLAAACAWVAANARYTADMSAFLPDAATPLQRLLVAELHHQVSRLLRCPAAVGVRGTGDVLDPSSRQRNEEQHVDPLQEGGLNGEEVAGQRGCRLLA